MLQLQAVIATPSCSIKLNFYLLLVLPVTTASAEHLKNYLWMEGACIILLENEGL